MRRVVLASGSPWRRDMLIQAGIAAVCQAPNVDESSISAADPVALAIARATAKARDVAVDHPDALVIGADQVAYLEGDIFGKPADPTDWMRRLEMLRGRTHQLTTGVALIDADGQDTFSVTTGVRFRGDVEDEELLRYIAGGEAAGCAGGYMVERTGAWLVEAVDGDWLNVVGLPLLPLIGRLRARGWRVPENVG